MATNMASGTIRDNSIQVRAWYNGSTEVGTCDFYVDGRHMVTAYYSDGYGSGSRTNWTTQYLTFSGLNPGTRYEFYAKFYNRSNGYIVSTAPFYFTTTGTSVQIPSRPTGLNTDYIGETDVSFYWYSVSGADGYYLYSDGRYLTSTRSTSAVFSNLRGGTRYTIGVSAYNSAGESSITTISFYTLDPIVIPTRPSYVSINTINRTDASFSWASSSGATGYHIYLDNYYQRSTTSTSGSVSGLSGGTSYTIGIAAYNSAGESIMRTASFTTTSNLQAPSIYVSSTTTNSATVVASATGAESYRLEYKDSVNNTWTAYTADYSSPIIVSGLYSGRTYTFRVRAVRGTEYGPYSSEVQAYIGHARPSNWEWEYTIASGGLMYPKSGEYMYLMSASHWNSFTTRINAFLVYKQLSQNTFTTAASSTTPTGVTSCVNQAITQINRMLPTGKMPSVYSNDVVTAKIFTDMVAKIKTIQV